jgi:TRAP transporter 4TM/12TM fusion protein
MADVASDAANQEKLDELIKKDEKKGRSMSGFWFCLAAGMGIFMVLFYMYCASEPIDTQYFYGLYVLITYVMVFLIYPLSSQSHGEKASFADGLITFFTLGLAVVMLVVAVIGEEASVSLFDNTWLMVVYAVVVAGVFAASAPMWRRPDQGHPSPLDIVLAVVSIFVVGYYIIEYEDLNYRMGSETMLDTIVSMVGIFISIEVARRLLGWSMTIVGLVFLCYAFWGDLLHAVPLIKAFAHTGFDIDRALNHIYLKQEGVFGIMCRVLVTYVILFIFFGSFLKASGASRFFLDLPMALAGKTVGGPAKVAVIASGFFGSVSGSAIANTVSTGAFTIPLMKRAGFRPHVAGAIEPSASIGGMFMPPIMGAGGFIMAEMTEIPYVDIMLMAIFPAVMYFLSVFVMIHFEAKRYGLVGIRTEDDPTAWDILKKEWYNSAPLVIIVLLMLMGRSPGMAAFWAIICCIMIMWVNSAKQKMEQLGLSSKLVDKFYGGPLFLVLALVGPELARWLMPGLGESQAMQDLEYALPPLTVLVMFILFGFVVLKTSARQKLESPLAALKSSLLEFVKSVLGAMHEGSFNTLIIGATVGVIGIIVGTIALTGIGLKFSQIIIELSFGYLPLAIILIGLASLVLGMGVPVTAAYLITAVLAVGAVSDMISQTFWGVSMQQLQEPLGELLRDDPQRAVIMGKVAWALIASHMIVYWFSQDSNITPPVCVAAYAGAAIAGSDPWKTGWTSFKFAKMLYIGPFLFAFSPGFLLGGPAHIAPWLDIILAMVTITLGTIAFGSLTMGYFLCGTNLVEWILCAVATVLLFFPDLLGWATGLGLPKLLVDMIGIGIWALVYVMQKMRIKSDPSLTLPVHEREKLARAAG